MATNVYAQRIIVNKLVNESQEGKKPNEILGKLKDLMKKYDNVVAFYLFMAEFYRQYNENRLVRFNSSSKNEIDHFSPHVTYKFCFFRLKRY